MASDGAFEAGSSGQELLPAEPVKRLKRPVKPDKEAHQAQIDQLQDELNKRRTRGETLKQRIEAKKQPAASPEVQELRNKQNALSSEFRGKVEKKGALREQVKALHASRDDLRTKIRDQRAKLGAFVTAQKIDERVQALDYGVNHTTMDLKAEERARAEIKRTAALKPLAVQFEENQVKLKASEKERESLMEQIKAQDQQIDGINKQRDKLEAEMAELRQKEAAKVQDVPAMIKEKDECREVMNAIWEKIQQLRADFKAKNNEFFEENKAWKEQQNQERAERNAQREKEYQAKQAERQAAAAEFAGEPYHKEVALCEQLLSHLGKYTSQAQAQASAPSPTASAKEASTAFEGMKAVTKGNKVDDEFGAFMGSATKKGKSKKGKQPASSQSQAGQKLNHSLDMIDAFHRLKVSVPTTTEKVPEAVKEVEDSKAYWLKKRQEVKETGVMPDEPSSSLANGVVKPSKAAKTPTTKSFNFSDQEFPGIPGHNGPVKPVSETPSKGKIAASAGEAEDTPEEVHTVEAAKDAPSEVKPSESPEAANNAPSDATEIAPAATSSEVKTDQVVKEIPSEVGNTDAEKDVPSAVDVSFDHDVDDAKSSSQEKD